MQEVTYTSECCVLFCGPAPSCCSPDSVGNAGLPLTNSRTYSAAFTDDAHFAVEEIQGRFPDAPLFAAGYSLGSLILTKYLAEADTGKWVGEGVSTITILKLARLGMPCGRQTVLLRCHAACPAYPSPIATRLKQGSSGKSTCKTVSSRMEGPAEQES